MPAWVGTETTDLLNIPGCQVDIPASVGTELTGLTVSCATHLEPYTYNV